MRVLLYNRWYETTDFLEGLTENDVGQWREKSWRNAWHRTSAYRAPQSLLIASTCRSLLIGVRHPRNPHNLAKLALVP